MRAELIGKLPINAMIKRGWLEAESVKDIESVESSLLRFFQANRLEDIETLPHAAKKTEVSIAATPAQLAWLYRVKTLASEMMVARYSPASVKSAIAEIKNLVHSAEELRKVPRILAEAVSALLSLKRYRPPKLTVFAFGWMATHPLSACHCALTGSTTLSLFCVTNLSMSKIEMG
ncbi:hypothetical protein [Roseicitreum antarcticum]|uniref:hypothetical protein n=1 Tax=Roseicitreum antarcticum TaxID=564137 RepID=UPI001CC1F128|nr:hypothetical protein [Roseicitreum antarcticum]